MSISVLVNQVYRTAHKCTAQAWHISVWVYCFGVTAKHINVQQKCTIKKCGAFQCECIALEWQDRAIHAQVTEMSARHSPLTANAHSWRTAQCAALTAHCTLCTVCSTHGTLCTLHRYHSLHTAHWRHTHCTPDTLHTADKTPISHVTLHH